MPWQSVCNARKRKKIINSTLVEGSYLRHLEVVGKVAAMVQIMPGILLKKNTEQLNGQIGKCIENKDSMINKWRVAVEFIN